VRTCAVALLAASALLLLTAAVLAANVLSPAPLAATSPQQPQQEWPPTTRPLLPRFLLPYDSASETILWTGGPHAYDLAGDLNSQFYFGEGSGLDFAAADGSSFPVLTMAAGTVV
jgi:murein DD-endopeptidase MepM/ murein hydrolase activator NlpD